MKVLTFVAMFAMSVVIVQAFGCYHPKTSGSSFGATNDPLDHVPSLTNNPGVIP